MKEEKTNKISIEKITDYAFCPFFYALKYKIKIENEEISLTKKYEEDIKKIIYYSFKKIQSEEDIRLENLKTAWGKLWIKDRRKTSIVFSETTFNKDIYNSKRKKGIETLISFYKNFESSFGFPVIINSKYEIPITSKLTLTGNYDIVKEVEINNTRYLESYIFKSELSKANKSNNIHSIASYVALRNESEYLNIKNMIYNLNSGVSHNLGDLKDKEAIFKKSVLNIYKSIYNNIFYRVPDAKCFNCSYCNICENLSKEFVDMIF